MKHDTRTTKRIPIREERGSYREPTLEEILSDSIVEAVMQADAVDPDELDAMLGRVARALRAAAPVKRASDPELVAARAAGPFCSQWPSRALCRFWPD
jgi:hypothetical protein